MNRPNRFQLVIFVLLIIMFSTSGCEVFNALPFVATATSYPTYTPYPTVTPYPTITDYPTYTPYPPYPTFTEGPNLYTRPADSDTRSCTLERENNINTKVSYLWYLVLDKKPKYGILNYHSRVYIYGSRYS